MFGTIIMQHCVQTMVVPGQNEAYLSITSNFLKKCRPDLAAKISILHCKTLIHLGLDLAFVGLGSELSSGTANADKLLLLH